MSQRLRPQTTTSFLKMSVEKKEFWLWAQAPTCDGGCRLVYTLIHKAQLNIDPFKAVLNSDFYQLGEKRGSIYAFCCLRVANTRIPFEPGFQNLTANQFYKFQTSVSAIIDANKAENSVYGKLVVA